MIVDESTTAEVVLNAIARVSAAKAAAKPTNKGPNPIFVRRHIAIYGDYWRRRPVVPLKQYQQRRRITRVK